MYQLVGMESQKINQKMKCVMHIVAIQCLLGKIVFIKVHILHINIRSDVLCNNFCNTLLRAFFCLLAYKIIP